MLMVVNEQYHPLFPLREYFRVTHIRNKFLLKVTRPRLAIMERNTNHKIAFTGNERTIIWYLLP